jgi:transposase
MAVSQDRVDLALRPPPDRWAVAHDARGTATLLDRLRTLAPALSVLEATGGLELPRTGALAAAGRPVVVVTPRQGRDFATATGQRAKTAVLDAAILAQFAEVVRPALRPLPAATTQALSAMRARRRQRLAMRTAESNRLGPALPPGRKGIRAPRAWRDRQLAQSSMPS